MIRGHAARRLIDKEEIEKFGEWAFGESYLKLSFAEEFLESWNNLHGESLYIYGNDEIDKSAEKMLDLWQELQKKNNECKVIT